MNSHKRIVILGGGSAGWMSANILAFSFHDQPVEIVLIESPAIPTVGVGEGSTPALKIFFDRLGITESDWMPACGATYKCGITFDGWVKPPGPTQYFHPFASSVDKKHSAQFMHDSNERLAGRGSDVHPNDYFLAAYLAKHHLAPVPAATFPGKIAYGYHFDAGKLGTFLNDQAVSRGVTHISDAVIGVDRSSIGDIQSVQLQSGRRVSGDFFLDCTGFSSLLAEQTLGVPHISYADLLLNDAAVALPSELTEILPSETVSSAMNHGWAWRIPLRDRFGNGYVYSSQHCSSDQAETELRAKLDLLGGEVPARHLKMRVGRLARSWDHNVLAVGLSQGFIEPLEATALLLIQQTVSLFCHYLIKDNFDSKHRADFNRQVAAHFDRTRDYIVAHYQTNSRDDTDYWKDARSNKESMSDSLKTIFDCWNSGRSLADEIRNQQIEQYYPVSSWYCLFVGMGLLPVTQMSIANSEIDSIKARNNNYSKSFPSQSALFG